MTTLVETRPQVAKSIAQAPVIGVVRTPSPQEALRQARALAAAGVELVEITFSVPEAPRLVRELLADRAVRPGDGPPWIGMGTVTTATRAREAIAAGAEFLVTPNTNAQVAGLARQAGLFLVMGALTPTEVVTAAELEADLVKVYPLPPVGGPAYLATIRQPLGDIRMLAAGGFGVEEIPAYRAAGAVAFGLAAPLLGAAPADDAPETARRVRRALDLARGGA
ncbi:MAG TPA: bifunctional 4-hydroxy-2-oxoglutarate aldolase/2-dehydro-3-deoxy-phosphogluconate aldolase [Thermoanaerobaculia bacterium]|nr:bifunctional 4-hydroxy-2-oxoglutarate aldolase/2-dehydro-3-deoxy-phosphogluconate aldolase [Thermoanaerobaculia bacterium]